jgi:transposase-like protein
VQDIFIVCGDGLKSFPDAIEARYPKAAVHLFLLHIVCHNMSLRKISKNRSSFPSKDALLTLFYLALNNISKKWTMPLRDCKAALTRFTIGFEERVPKP